MPRARYIAYSLIFLAVAGVSGLLYRGIDRAIASLGCFETPPAGYFLAYCSSPGFGDYEHGAYYYNLQPSALEHLRAADVVFFGTSRAQIALSVDPVKRFFDELKIKHYALGFGYEEQGAFPLALIRKHDIFPRAIVIFADPFFRDRTAGIVRVSSKDWLRWRVVTELYESTLKHMIVLAGRAFCAGWSALCEQDAVKVFRSIQYGTWKAAGFDYSKPRPITSDASFVYTADMVEADQAFATHFIDSTKVPRRCVILSSVPSPAVNSDQYVREMGRRLGVRVVLPLRDGLQSFDGNHISPDSAERWTADLLSEARDALRDCP